MALDPMNPRAELGMSPLEEGEAQQQGWLKRFRGRWNPLFDGLQCYWLTATYSDSSRESPAGGAEDEVWSIFLRSALCCLKRKDVILLMLDGRIFNHSQVAREVGEDHVRAVRSNVSDYLKIMVDLVSSHKERFKLESLFVSRRLLQDKPDLHLGAVACVGGAEENMHCLFDEVSAGKKRRSLQSGKGIEWIIMPNFLEAEFDDQAGFLVATTPGNFPSMRSCLEKAAILAQIRLILP